MKAESRSADLDIVVDELVGLVVGYTFGWGYASCFEASLTFHGVGDGQAGQGRWED
jgi:hypothetical protein